MAPQVVEVTNQIRYLAKVNIFVISVYMVVTHFAVAVALAF